MAKHVIHPTAPGPSPRLIGGAVLVACAGLGIFYYMRRRAATTTSPVIDGVPTGGDLPADTHTGDLPPDQYVQDPPPDQTPPPNQTPPSQNPPTGGFLPGTAGIRQRAAMLRQVRGSIGGGGADSGADTGGPDPSTPPPGPMQQGAPVILPNNTRVMLPIGASLTVPADYPVRTADGTRVMIPAGSSVTLQALVFALISGDANALQGDGGQLVLPTGTLVSPRQLAVRASDGTLVAQVAPIPALYNGALVTLLGLTTAALNADTIVTR